MLVHAIRGMPRSLSRSTRQAPAKPGSKEVPLEAQPEYLDWVQVRRVSRKKLRLYVRPIDRRALMPGGIVEHENNLL